MIDAKNFINPIAIKPLREPRPYQVFLATIILWAQLVAAWWMALYGSVWFYFPAFLIICACISAMQLWVHESSHSNLFKNRYINDIFATLFFASPIGMSVKTYRYYHMTHHAYLGTPADMDRFAFNINIKDNMGLIKMLLRGLCCIDGLKIILSKYLNVSSKKNILPVKKDWFGFISILSWNGLLFIVCIMMDKWYLYFILWAYPIVGVAVTINSIRSIAEHQPLDFYQSVNNDENIRPIIRTTLPNFSEKWFVYQCNFNYHVEHHLYPFIPAIHLPKIHAHLVKNGFYHQYPDLLQTSGVKKLLVLRSLTKLT